MRLFLKNLLFTIVVPGTVGVYVPLFVVPHGGTEIAFVVWVGALLVVAGAGIYLWCVWDFASFGRGTPAPVDPPQHLVARGLYRYTRNPMYVGVLSVIAGWAIVFSSLGIAVYGMVVAACFHAFVVLYEEPHLRRVFKESYAAYCARVGRWLSIGKG